MRRHIASVAVVLLILAVLPAACEDTAAPFGAPADNSIAPEPSPPEEVALPIVVPASYQIAAEDVLQMDVWGEPDLTKIQFQVTPDGNINPPFIGSVEAIGKTQQQLARDIAQAYVDEEIFIAPRVNITLIVMHKPTARVMGQVFRPGVIEFKDGDTVMEAIAQAGSYTQDALLTNATLTRKDSTEPIRIDLKALFKEGDMSQNLKLEKGDTIYLPEDTINKYYVLGEVMRPGLFALRDNATVLSGVMGAGGATPRASWRSTMLIRGDPENPEKVPVNLAKLVADGDVSEDVELKPGDVIFVPESKKPDINKISGFLNALISVSYLRRYGMF